MLQADGHPAESSASGKLTGPLPWDILDELSEDDDLSTTAGTGSLTLSFVQAAETTPGVHCELTERNPLGGAVLILLW